MKIRAYFIRHPDGSWEPRQAVTITAGGAPLTVNPGVRFMPGVLFNGIDVARLCEQDANI